MANNATKLTPAENAAVDTVFPKGNDAKNHADAQEIEAKVQKAGGTVKPDPKDVGIIKDAINKSAKGVDPNLPKEEYAKEVVANAMKEEGVEKAVDRISKSNGSWVSGAIKTGLIKGTTEEIANKHDTLHKEISAEQAKANKTSNTVQASRNEPVTTAAPAIATTEQPKPETPKATQQVSTQSPPANNSISGMAAQMLATAQSMIPKEMQAALSALAEDPAIKNAIAQAGSVLANAAKATGITVSQATETSPVLQTGARMVAQTTNLVGGR